MPLTAHGCTCVTTLNGHVIDAPDCPVHKGATCYLARHGKMEGGRPMAPCVGRLVRAHLIRQQVIENRIKTLAREQGKPPDLAVMACQHIIWHKAVWVWACGGEGYGSEGHHGMLDHTRKLKLPRSAIPADCEQFAEELGLTWWLDRTYGVQP